MIRLSYLRILPSSSRSSIRPMVHKLERLSWPPIIDMTTTLEAAVSAVASVAFEDKTKQIINKIRTLHILTMLNILADWGRRVFLIYKSKHMWKIYVILYFLDLISTILFSSLDNVSVFRNFFLAWPEGFAPSSTIAKFPTTRSIWFHDFHTESVSLSILSQHERPIKAVSTSRLSLVSPTWQLLTHLTSWCHRRFQTSVQVDQRKSWPLEDFRRQNARSLKSNFR